MMEGHILIVDDEEYIRHSLTGVLNDEGYKVSQAETGEDAIKICSEEEPDLVLLDIWMPGMDGIDTLKYLKNSFPNINIIMITGHGTIETAVKAIKMGAYDFIEKPLDLHKVLLTINNALKYKKLEQENRILKNKISKRYELTGKSKAIIELKKQIERAAPTNAWILITGENGTGKELVARAIYLKSKRADKPFVEVNCAAIPEELIESELFGHEKGAFTGATSMKRGKFDLANGGTLFLDEIGDMSLKTQAKILRLLEEQKFERVGGIKTISVDVRVIAATNKNLLKEIEKGNFREDLYYRLNVIPFHVPSLRERKEDIPLLVDYFLKFFAKENNQKLKKVTPEVLELFMEYNWPGNVRELKNTIERLVIMTPSETITKEDVNFLVKKEEVDIAANSLYLKTNSLKEATEVFQKFLIEKKLKENNFNITLTAKELGTTRINLHRKIKELNIMVDRKS